MARAGNRQETLRGFTWVSFIPEGCALATVSLAFFFVHVCETVQACEAWNYKCGAAVNLLRKLFSRWKVKPRDWKNKDGEREQDKEEVRVPEGTACSLVKFGLKNFNWRQCVFSFSSHCRQTIDIFMNLQIIKFKRTEEKHYPSGVVELKENSGLQ